MVDNQGCSPALEPVPTPPNPDPSSISQEAWDPLEAAAGAVVARIQPNPPSEDRRAAVIAYVQHLLRNAQLYHLKDNGDFPPLSS
uniref:Uncharacterized protein n=1 Tax=Oryza meridionalis TaxID=40149 RepID=A0A0E0F904_9ORYZ